MHLLKGRMPNLVSDHDQTMNEEGAIGPSSGPLVGSRTAKVRRRRSFPGQGRAALLSKGWQERGKVLARVPDSRRQDQ